MRLIDDKNIWEMFSPFTWRAEWRASQDLISQAPHPTTQQYFGITMSAAYITTQAVLHEEKKKIGAHEHKNQYFMWTAGTAAI